MVFRRIERDAMVDGQGNVAVVEELHQVVDVLERRAAGGDDHRLLRRGDLFDQHPVVQVRAGDLEDLDAELAAQIHGVLIERRGHADAVGLPDRLHQADVIFRRELRVQRFLDVADVVTAAEIAMDEVLNVAQLDLDGGAHVVKAHHLAVGGDDLQPALDTSQMVVRHLQYKQLIEKIRTRHLETWSLNRKISSLRTCLQFTGHCAAYRLFTSEPIGGQLLRREEGIHVLQRRRNNGAVRQYLGARAWLELLLRVKHNLNQGRTGSRQRRLYGPHLGVSPYPYARDPVGLGHLYKVGERDSAGGAFAHYTTKKVGLR